MKGEHAHRSLQAAVGGRGQHVREVVAPLTQTLAWDDGTT
jgi:hypothetical protein